MKEKHEAACKEEPDQRKVKVKEERKVRKEAEKTRVDNKSAEMMNNFKDLGLAFVASSSVREEFKKATLEAAEEVASAKMSKKK